MVLFVLPNLSLFVLKKILLIVTRVVHNIQVAYIYYSSPFIPDFKENLKLLFGIIFTPRLNFETARIDSCPILTAPI